MFFIIILTLLVVKIVWVTMFCWNNETLDDEKEELLQRRNYLVEKIMVAPGRLIQEMPDGIGLQFQGEWALYSCSMFAIALTHMAELYPETKNDAIATVDSLIQIVQSPELRLYDKLRWGEDPLDTLDGNKSHISYLSHLAWMIGNYKRIGGDEKYDQLYDTLCTSMNHRILLSPVLNLPTYPGEPIYIPDMLVAVVALAEYSKNNDGKYQDTVDKWLKRAKIDWLDMKTGLLVSKIDENGNDVGRIKGSYSALNCFYLSLIDSEFARDQYGKLKAAFRQRFPIGGIKEYCDRSCWFGVDIDAGPIVMNLSPSGIAFAIGCATHFNDMKFRNQLLRTAEIFGHSVKWNDKRHYLLADIALVGEAITLAMRTNRTGRAASSAR